MERDSGPFNNAQAHESRVGASPNWAPKLGRTCPWFHLWGVGLPGKLHRYPSICQDQPTMIHRGQEKESRKGGSTAPVHSVVCWWQSFVFIQFEWKWVWAMDSQGGTVSGKSGSFRPSLGPARVMSLRLVGSKALCVTASHCNPWIPFEFEDVSCRMEHEEPSTKKGKWGIQGESHTHQNPHRRKLSDISKRTMAACMHRTCPSISWTGPQKSLV